MSARHTRRLAAIIASDIVGYSRLMALDEEGTLSRVQHLRDTISEPAIAELNGRIVKRTGDGALVEFSSVVDAVRAAHLVQERVTAHEADQPEDIQIRLRIGVNLGDVLVEENDIFGDAVNVAARLEQICPPGAVMVSGTAFDNLANRSEFPFRDVGEQLLKNIPVPVRAYCLDGSDGTANAPAIPADEAPMRAELPGKPSLVVLPFANLSSDPDQVFFCDGLSEDVISALSRFAALFVISRNTSFAFRDRQFTSREVSRELGVQYVVDGSVRSAGDRIRVVANLVDAINDRPIWSERYDGSSERVFDIQDEIVQQIVGAVAPEVMINASRFSRKKPAQDLTTWELIARANDHASRFTQGDSEACQNLARQALENEPENVTAISVLAYSIALDALYGWHRPQKESVMTALRLAQDAVGIENRDSFANVALAISYSLAGQLDLAWERYEIAIEANPNFAVALGWKGCLCVYMDRLDVAEELLRTALRLSPRDPTVIWVQAHLGLMAFFQRDFRTAVQEMKKAIALNPKVPSLHRGMTTFLAMAGETEAAKEHCQIFTQMVPGVTIAQTLETLPFQKDEQAELFAEGLRRAGMPE